MACQVSSLRGEILASNHKHDGAMDDERSGFRDQTIDDALWRTFTYNHGDVRITTADRHMEREALNQSILLAASAPVLMALLGSLGLLWIGLGKGLEPLNCVRDALRSRRADSVEPLQVAGMPSELQTLLETQNQLFRRIAQTLERERRLTDGAVREQALEHAGMARLADASSINAGRSRASHPPLFTANTVFRSQKSYRVRGWRSVQVVLSARQL